MKAEDLATRLGAPVAEVLRLKDLFELEGWTGVHVIPQGASSWVAAIDDAILKMEGVANLKTFLRKRKVKEQSDANLASEQLYDDEEEAAIPATHHDQLVCRQIHHLVVEAAGRLFRQRHYDEAVERAFKKLASRVKKMTKRRDVDGVELMNQAFSVDRPILRLNPLQNKFERGEQVAWMNFFCRRNGRTPQSGGTRYTAHGTGSTRSADDYQRPQLPARLSEADSRAPARELARYVAAFFPAHFASADSCSFFGSLRCSSQRNLNRGPFDLFLQPG